MGDVIYMHNYKKKKSSDDSVVEQMKKSLDNEEVKRRYNIKPKKEEELTSEQRSENIKQSISRINALMKELDENNGRKPK